MRLPHVLFVLALLCISLFSCNSGDSSKQNLNDSAATDTVAVKFELLTSEISKPVDMKAAPDTTHRLFIGDLGGKIWIVKNGKVLPKPFIDISSRLEQKDTTPSVKAMLSIAFHPQFATNGKFYIYYHAPAKDTAEPCNLMIAEFKVSSDNPDMADLSSERKVLEIDGHELSHDACNLAFGPDGYLYISVGDNDESKVPVRHAQHLDSYMGKLLRIDVNQTPYGIPADNPFVGVKDAKPEIWAYGFRRLWRFSFDPESQLLLGGDVGDKKDEELDIIEKGGNYGWPIKEGDSLHDKPTTEDTSKFKLPVNTYPRTVGICIVGGNIYHGKNMPQLTGQYVFADFSGSLFSAAKNADGQWIRKPLKIVNPPADPFIIFSYGHDENNEMYVMGIINEKAGAKSVVYKITSG